MQILNIEGEWLKKIIVKPRKYVFKSLIEIDENCGGFFNFYFFLVFKFFFFFSNSFHVIKQY